jgi:hypothetical protein
MRTRSNSKAASEASVPVSALARSLADQWGVEQTSTGRVWPPGESWKGALDRLVHLWRRVAPRGRLTNRHDGSFVSSIGGSQRPPGPAQSPSAMVFSHRTFVPIVKRSALEVTNEEI